MASVPTKAAISPEQAKLASKIAARNTLTLAVVGCAGEGKSTLVNSLLLIDPKSPEAAKAADEGETVTMHVRSHKMNRDGAKVIIWDTPGLGDDSHVKQKTVINELRRQAGDDVDLCLFCIAYRRGLRVTDGHRNVIKLLTDNFGNKLWKKACLVMTMVNDVKDPKKIQSLKHNVERELTQGLRDVGVPEDVIKEKKLLLAGEGTTPLLISENEEIDWNTNLYLECFNAIEDEKKRATFTQARYGEAVWVGGNLGGLVAGPGGAVVGAVVGGIIGGLLTKLVTSFSTDENKPLSK